MKFMRGGYISVLNGVFVDMSKTPSSFELQNYIKQIVNTSCDFHNQKTKSYFEWHFNQNK